MSWTTEQYAEYCKKHGIEAPAVQKPSKYHNKRTNGHASKHEDDIASELHLRAKAERITVLEQVPFELAGGVKYIADFVILHPGGRYEILDAKGVRTPVYRLKKWQMADLWEMEIEEV